MAADHRIKLYSLINVVKSVTYFNMSDMASKENYSALRDNEPAKSDLTVITALSYGTFHFREASVYYIAAFCCTA